MIAAQYEVALPADYDMGIIRKRVSDRGSAMDDRAGLGIKAYLIRDIAAGSPVNAYAPFYLWRDPAALAAFHWGGRGFAGITRDFGRPAVRTWIGHGFARGVEFRSTPYYAVRRLQEIAPDTDLVDAAADLTHRNAATARGDGVHSQAWGIDPTVWQSVEFTLLTERPDAADAADAVDGTLYHVLHLSAPELHELPTAL